MQDNFLGLILKVIKMRIC